MIEWEKQVFVYDFGVPATLFVECNARSIDIYIYLFCVIRHTHTDAVRACSRFRRPTFDTSVAWVRAASNDCRAAVEKLNQNHSVRPIFLCRCFPFISSFITH